MDGGDERCILDECYRNAAAQAARKIAKQYNQYAISELVISPKSAVSRNPRIVSQNWNAATIGLYNWHWIGICYHL